MLTAKPLKTPNFKNDLTLKFCLPPANLIFRLLKTKKKGVEKSWILIE